MAFFRTRDNLRDPKARDEARKQRRQQLQAQQQILDRHKAEAAHAEPTA